MNYIYILYIFLQKIDFGILPDTPFFFLGLLLGGFFLLRLLRLLEPSDIETLFKLPSSKSLSISGSSSSLCETHTQKTIKNKITIKKTTFGDLRTGSYR